MKRLAKLAWAGVVLTALALSNWSLFYVGRHYGLPVPLAVLLSVPFDGAALVSASIALNYAKEHGSHGNGVRAAVLVLAGLSAWLNSMHATLIGAPLPAHVMYAIPPLVALYLFEAHIRYERRDALRAAGRLPDAQPILGAFIWLRHPWHAHGAMQAISGKRLSSRIQIEQAHTETRLAIEQAEAQVSPAAILDGVTSKADAVRIAAGFTDGSAVEALKWLTKNQAFLPGPLRGFTLAYVSQCLDRDKARSNGSAEHTGQLVLPSDIEPSWTRTGMMPAPVNPGDYFTGGCGHQIYADRIVRLGDLYPCQTCKASTPYLGGLRLSELLSARAG